MTAVRHAPLLSLALLPLSLACVIVVDDTGGTTIGDGGAVTDGGATGDGGGGDGGGGDAGSSDGGGGDGGTTEPDPIHGQIRGMVSVQFYRDTAMGREYVDWADTPWPDSFPFGSIFVAAVQATETGGLKYRGDDTVMAPVNTGDEYALTVELPESGEVNLTATLDFNRDGVLSTSEPYGVHPDQIIVTDGSKVGDKDIVILVDYDYAYAYFFGGGGGGGCSTYITLSGDAILTSPWAGGDVAVLAYDTAGNGPYDGFARGEPTTSGGGAEMPFQLGLCNVSSQDVVIRGAWDRNGNELIDPADLWGALISKPDVDGNPLTVGTTDIAGLEVQIPLGDGEYDLSVVPFVRISGSVLYEGGASFDGLPAGSNVYAAALLYRPTGDITVSYFRRTAYSVSEWEPSDYAGKTSLPYAMWVPTNTIVYIWGFVDHGPTPDGVVNTPDEIVGSGGSGVDGRTPIGRTDLSGQDIALWNVVGSSEE